MKPVVIIAISVVCSVGAVIAVLALAGSSGESGNTSIFQQGKLILDRNGYEFGTEKYVLLTKIQEETWGMNNFQTSDYVYPRWGDDPVYEAECQRFLEELFCHRFSSEAERPSV